MKDDIAEFCVHKWLIEIPLGPSVRAICTKCKLMRKLPNPDYSTPVRVEEPMAPDDPKDPFPDY